MCKDSILVILNYDENSNNENNKDQKANSTEHFVDNESNVCASALVSGLVLCVLCHSLAGPGGPRCWPLVAARTVDAAVSVPPRVLLASARPHPVLRLVTHEAPVTEHAADVLGADLAVTSGLVTLAVEHAES